MPDDDLFVSIDTSQWDKLYRKFQDEAEDIVLNRMGDAAVDQLQSPGSEWPVDTGESKESFDYSLGIEQVDITNDTDYAIFVEERTGAARSELEDNIDQIAEQASKALEKILRD